jgi:hypothetical protein
MNHPPFCEVFAGKACSFVFDQHTLPYRFSDCHTLYRLDSHTGSWQEETYECYASSAEGLYFLFHEVREAVPPACRAFAIDLSTNRATLLNCVVGIEDYTNQDVDILPCFGSVDFHDGKAPSGEPHHYTRDGPQGRYVARQYLVPDSLLYQQAVFYQSGHDRPGRSHRVRTCAAHQAA